MTRFAADGRTLGVYAAGNGAHDVAVDAAGAVCVGRAGTRSFLRVRKVPLGGTTEWYSPQLIGNGPLALGNGHVLLLRPRFDPEASTRIQGRAMVLERRGAGWKPARMPRPTSPRPGAVSLRSRTIASTCSTPRSTRSGPPVGGPVPRGSMPGATDGSGSCGHQFVEVYDGELSSLGRNDPPAPRGVAEFGDEIYTLMGTSHVLRMKKAFELVPCGGALAGVVCVPPAPPVDDPAPGAADGVHQRGAMSPTTRTSA